MSICLYGPFILSQCFVSFYKGMCGIYWAPICPMMNAKARIQPICTFCLKNTRQRGASLGLSRITCRIKNVLARMKSGQKNEQSAPVIAARAKRSSVKL